MRNSIAGRFNLTLGLALAALLALSGLGQFVVQSQGFARLSLAVQSTLRMSRDGAAEATRQDQRSRAEQLSHMLAEIAPPAIASFDLSSLQRFAETSVADTDVVRVEYFTEDGTSIASQKKANEVEIFTVSHPIIHEGTSLGKVVIAMTDNRLRSTLTRLDDSAALAQQRIGEVSQETTTYFTSATIAGFALLAVIIILTSAWLFRVMVFRRLDEVTRAMRRLAKDDPDALRSLKRSGDEIGSMVDVLMVFREGLAERRRLEQDRLDTAARTERERHEAMAGLASKLESTVQSVVESIQTASEDMRSTARVMATDAEATSSQISTAAAAAFEASRNVDSVASATEELEATLRNMAQQVTESAQIMGDAATAARRADQTVTALSSAASRIGEIVQLIHSIASQTNLLALNATIEAARAGDAGKGFAVVASEVKQLANQTAHATEEISAQISAIQGTSRQAVEAITAITRVIGRTEEISGAVAAAVNQQHATTQEISRSVAHAAEGTRVVAESIDQVTRVAQGTREQANRLADSTTSLVGNVMHMHEEIETFLHNVRAA